MPRRRWTDEQLAEAVKEARSIRQVLLRLGLREGGGQYRVMYRAIAELGLDTSHFLGQGWNRDNVGGQLRNTPRPLEEILVRDSTYTCSNSLKKRLLNERLLEERCQLCGLDPVWQGKRLVLRLDHINGHATDHRLENLRLLCPNCDSQTPTFAGRNKGKARRSKP